MRKSTRKRLRPRAEIAPIHVSELLSGAGMTGFLAVLNPPAAVPHLQNLVGQPSREVAQAGSAQPSRDEQELQLRVTNWAAGAVRRLGAQQETLLAILALAQQVNGRAQRLRRAMEGAGDAKPLAGFVRWGVS